MTEDEIAFRAAINVLRDSVETGRMPSGVALEPDAAALHERAVQHLETRLSRSTNQDQRDAAWERVLANLLVFDRGVVRPEVFVMHARRCGWPDHELHSLVEAFIVLAGWKRKTIRNHGTVWVSPTFWPQPPPFVTSLDLPEE